MPSHRTRWARAILVLWERAASPPFSGHLSRAVCTATRSIPGGDCRFLLGSLRSRVGRTRDGGVSSKRAGVSVRRRGRQRSQRSGRASRERSWRRGRRECDGKAETPPPGPRAGGWAAGRVSRAGSQLRRSASPADRYDQLARRGSSRIAAVLPILAAHVAALPRLLELMTAGIGLPAVFPVFANGLFQPLFGFVHVATAAIVAVIAVGAGRSRQRSQQTKRQDRRSRRVLERHLDLLQIGRWWWNRPQ